MSEDRIRFEPLPTWRPWPEILLPIGRILAAVTLALLVVVSILNETTARTMGDLVDRQAARIQALETQQRELRLRIQALELGRDLDRIKGESL